MNIIADTNIFLAVALNEPEKKPIIEITSEALDRRMRQVAEEMGIEVLDIVME